MDTLIKISNLNDFIFCPASIYFHNLYGKTDNVLYQSDFQLNGTKAHEAVDSERYSTRKNIITSLEVFCDKYGLIGMIDTFDEKKGILTERKKHINEIYDGYVFQIYAQYFCLKEMGYKVKKIRFYSMDDNKIYNVALPEENVEMLQKFENVIATMRTMNLNNFVQENENKCAKCIYEPACDRAAYRRE